MNLLTAKNLATDLMKQHIPNATDWTFKFNNAKNILGECICGRKIIKLSRFYVQNADESEVKRTILHEIAHALAGHKAGHGYLWRVMARQVGIENPSRTARVNNQFVQAVQQEANYSIKCPNCGPIAYAHRMGTKMRYSSYRCQKCGTTGLKWKRN